MKRVNFDLLSVRRRLTIFGGLLIVGFSSLYFFSVPAKTEGIDEAVDLLLGRAWRPLEQRPNTLTISGRITGVGIGVNAVTINLRGTINATAATGPDGNYQFSGLPEGGNYVVSPSFPNHYFTPPNRSYDNLSTNQTADYVAREVCISTNCARNGKIAFVISVGTANIFTMNPDGSNQTNITNNQANTNIDPPDFSPDGTKIAFATNRDGNDEIYWMSADGSNPTRLTNNTAADRMPHYSPDGASILFVSNRDGNNEIYKMNADGSNPVRLTENTGADLYPAFSPDGQKIVFVTTRTGGERLFTMNADGSNPQLLSDDVGGGYERPSYSPDGTKIIFAHSALPTVPEAKRIWTMNANGTNPTQIAGSGHAAMSPTWSPDGTAFAYQCCFRFPEPPGSPDNVNGIYAPGRITVGINHYAPDWQPIIAPRRTASDFDGDGRSDISVFRPSDGIWYLLRSTAGFSAVQWGLSDDKLVAADYDGDLKSDLAVWRETDGAFYVLNSFDATVRIENLGAAGDVPTGGDFDRDGKADAAVYRPGDQSFFYYRASMGNPQGDVTSIPWGTTGDKPVVGDYDGDARSDVAVFRPSDNTWYIRRTSNGELLTAFFGAATDTLVPADYDGDGKTDIAVFRSGTWYMLRSALGFAAFQWGMDQDIPTPADYDGDGRADPTIFRNGVWWILKSGTGAAEAHSFGTATDKPIPAAYVR